MALMVPTITLQGVQPGQTPVATNLTSSDAVYFVIGAFEGDFTDAAIQPGMVSAALAQSAAFVLPGTTLGIFPTGLIVTCAWTLLFFVAFGFGTLGRIKHRSNYRKRMAATRGRRGAS